MIKKRGILYDILNPKNLSSKDTTINPLTLSEVVSNVYKSKKLKGLIELDQDKLYPLINLQNYLIQIQFY